MGLEFLGGLDKILGCFFRPNAQVFVELGVNGGRKLAEIYRKWAVFAKNVQKLSRFCIVGNAIHAHLVAPEARQF